MTSGLPVILIGMMGTGKSVVGKRVAEILGLPQRDTDAEIETTTSKTITEIFEELGEATFRSLESETLLKVLSDDSTGVISLGGGALLASENRNVLRGKGTVVWLYCSPEELARRLMDDSTRPLLRGETLRESLRVRQEERSSGYEELADISIDTTSLDIEVVARVIVENIAGGEARE